MARTVEPMQNHPDTQNQHHCIYIREGRGTLEALADMLEHALRSGNELPETGEVAR